MKNRFRGLGRVFSFTFRRQLAQPGYRRLTILLALLCLLLPALLLRLTAAPAGGAAEDVPLCAAREIVVLDRTEGEPVALGWLNDLRPEGWPSADYTSTDASRGGADVLLVTLERAESGDFTLAVTVPEGSGLTQADADAYASFLSGYADNILRAKAGLAPFETADEETLADAVYSVLAMLVPYLCLMVLYFMVLFYGQSVAGCVLMEKTSKLMDFFLVTVEPAAMVLGKILATALAGILQMAVWLASLAGGGRPRNGARPRGGAGADARRRAGDGEPGAAHGAVQPARPAPRGRNHPRGLSHVLLALRDRWVARGQGRGSRHDKRAVFHGAGGELPRLHHRGRDGRLGGGRRVAGLGAVHSGADCACACAAR